MAYRDSLQRPRDWPAACQLLLFALVWFGGSSMGMGAFGYLVAGGLVVYAAAVPMSLLTLLDPRPVWSWVRGMAPRIGVMVAAVVFAVAVQNAGPEVFNWIGSLAAIVLILAVVGWTLLKGLRLAGHVFPAAGRSLRRQVVHWLANGLAMVRASV